MNNPVPIIVITGGPCHLKPQVISYVEQQLRQRDISVVTLGENLVDWILSDMHHSDIINSPEFHIHTLEHIMSMEDGLKKVARFMRNKHKVILCWHGALDRMAHTHDEMFTLVMEHLSCTIVQLCERYHAVVILRSTAFVAPDQYRVIHGQSLAQAQELDARTLAVWKDHPALRIIEHADLKRRKEEALQAVLQAMLTLERRFSIAT